MWSARKQACACALMLLAVPGFAQTPDEAPDEPPEEETEPESRYEDRFEDRFEEEITVVEKKEPSLTLPGPETAAREIAEIPGGAALVDAEDYKRGRASTLKDALDFTPGVFVQPRFGAEEARLSIRGSGLQRTFHGRGIKLLQDGIPLNLADGAFDFQAVEPLSARYIEVYRGGNGLRYGSSTLGGAINYVSQSGYGAPPAQVRLEGGAYGYLRGQAAAGLVRGRLDGFATLTSFSQDGFRDHSVQSTNRFFGNFGWRLDEDRETRFFVTSVKTDSELPGNLTKAQLEADPTQAAPGNLALDQKRDFNLFRLSNHTTLPLGPSSRLGRLELGAFWSYKDLDHPIFQVLAQKSNDVGAEVRYERNGKRNLFVVGFSPAAGVVEDDRFVNVGGRRGARTADGETTSLNLDLYAEDRHELRPGLTLTAGAQLSRAFRDFDDDFLANGDQTDRQEFDGFSPKLGLMWNATSAASIFANVSRSFEPPSFGELVSIGGSGLLQLDAQTATTIEAGTRGHRGPISWDLAAYQARLDGELLSLNDAAGNPLGTLNAGRTLHTGIEAGLEVRLVRGLLWRQVYNWSRFSFADDPTFGDNQLAGIPEHYARAELLYETASGFYGGPNVEWVPDDYPVDHANTLYAEGYTILGLKLGYRAAGGLAGFVEAKNLTGETYASTTGVIADARGLDSAQFLPGDGASVFAGLEYRW